MSSFNVWHHNFTSLANSNLFVGPFLLHVARNFQSCSSSAYAKNRWGSLHFFSVLSSLSISFLKSWHGVICCSPWSQIGSTGCYNQHIVLDLRGFSSSVYNGDAVGCGINISQLSLLIINSARIKSLHGSFKINSVVFENFFVAISFIIWANEFKMRRFINDKDLKLSFFFVQMLES